MRGNYLNPRRVGKQTLFARNTSATDSTNVNSIFGFRVHLWDRIEMSNINIDVEYYSAIHYLFTKVINFILENTGQVQVGFETLRVPYVEYIKKK